MHNSTGCYVFNNSFQNYAKTWLPKELIIFMNKRYREAFDVVKYVINVNALFVEAKIYISLHLRVMENPLYCSRCCGFVI